MKFFCRVVSVTGAFIFSLFMFTGCSFDRQVAKASKGLSTYEIEAVYCDVDKKISAVEKVNYINSVDTILDEVWFNLYGAAFSDSAKVKPYAKARAEDCFPNGVNYGDLEVKTVLVDGVNATFEIVGEDNNALKVLLGEQLFAGEAADIVIEYELYLSNCTHRLGYFDNTVNLGNWYPIAAVYENDHFIVDPYYSNGDPFYSNCANYKVTISYDSKFSMASTGNLVEEIQDANVKTSTYEALAVRDFAMCLATNWTKESCLVGETTVSVFAYEGDENLNEYLKTASRTVELFNKKFGEYPYRELRVVFTHFFQGGMEYPGLVYISDSVKELEEIKKVIIHEIAHQWWYGIVGNNEVEDAWFDEGLAEYSTLIYYETYLDEGVDSEELISDTITSYELYLDVIKSLNIEINYSMQLSLDEYKTEYEYVYMIYVKGMLFFDDMREKLGDEQFFELLQNIYKDYKFKIVDKEGFLLELEKITGLDMTEYVESWLSGKVDISHK